MIFNGPELVTIPYHGCSNREEAWKLTTGALKDYLSESESIDFEADVKVEKFTAIISSPDTFEGEVVFSVN